VLGFAHELKFKIKEQTLVRDVFILHLAEKSKGHLRLLWEDRESYKKRIAQMNLATPSMV
jgi:hypothetical protein